MCLRGGRRRGAHRPEGPVRLCGRDSGHATSTNSRRSGLPLPLPLLPWVPASSPDWTQVRLLETSQQAGRMETDLLSAPDPAPGLPSAGANDAGTTGKDLGHPEPRAILFARRRLGGPRHVTADSCSLCGPLWVPKHLGWAACCTDNAPPRRHPCISTKILKYQYFSRYPQGTLTLGILMCHQPTHTMRLEPSLLM